MGKQVMLMKTWCYKLKKSICLRPSKDFGPNQTKVKRDL
jgi:hypothetical protein